MITPKNKIIILVFTQVFAKDKDEPFDSVEMKFLRYKCSGEWEYPKTDDIKMIDAKYVFFGPVTPTFTRKSVYSFAEDNEASRLFKIIQKKNY